jgi:hypothetical protein
MNVMYTVLNADIPVIYRGGRVPIHVKSVIDHSVINVVLLHINAYIVVSVHMLVKYVVRHSVSRAV